MDADPDLLKRVTRPRSRRSSASSRVPGYAAWRVRRRGRAVSGRVVVLLLVLFESVSESGDRVERVWRREVRKAEGVGRVLVEVDMEER